MQQTLIATVFSIEKKVISGGQQQQLLIQIHQLSKQIASYSKQQQSTIQHNRQIQKERKQLHKKLKKTNTKMEKKEEECEQLRRELASIKDVYEYKLQKMLKAQSEKHSQVLPITQIRRQRRSSKSTKGRDVQCEILNGELVKELQERNLCLLRKINLLEKELEEEKNQNNSKQLYIESLISALEGQVQKDLEEELGNEAGSGGGGSSCGDINDNSTIDADSLKDQDRQSQFSEGEKREWLQSQTPDGELNSKWYDPFLNAFKSAKTIFWRE